MTIERPTAAFYALDVVLVEQNYPGYGENDDVLTTDASRTSVLLARATAALLRLERIQAELRRFFIMLYSCSMFC